MPTPLSANPHFWGWLAVALVMGGLLYLLSPILAPFLFAAILAYILDPLVERLTGKFVPRTLAVLLAMFGVLVAIAALVGVWLFQRELRRVGLPDNAVDAGMAGVLGGLALFGFAGIVLGPILVAFLNVAARLLRRRFAVQP